MEARNITQLWNESSDGESAIGEPIVDQALLNQIGGGACSSGWVCSVSGECNCSGRSCWPF